MIAKYLVYPGILSGCIAGYYMTAAFGPLAIIPGLLFAASIWALEPEFLDWDRFWTRMIIGTIVFFFVIVLVLALF